MQQSNYHGSANVCHGDLQKQFWIHLNAFLNPWMQNFQHQGQTWIPQTLHSVSLLGCWAKTQHLYPLDLCFLFLDLKSLSVVKCSSRLQYLWWLCRHCKKTCLNWNLDGLKVYIKRHITMAYLINKQRLVINNYLPSH